MIITLIPIYVWNGCPVAMDTSLVEQFCWCHDPTVLVCYQYTKYHQILWGSISKLVWCLARITLKSPTFNHVTSIKSFYISTLYTTIPHQKLNDSLTSRYNYLVLGHEETYFVKEHSDSKNKYSEDDIIKMLEFLVDNIVVVFAGKVFQQTVGIPMGTN